MSEKTNELSDESSNESSNELSESSDENIEQLNNLDLNGKIINNYNVILELGRGACSIVWLVYNITNNNFYALKVQNPDEFKSGYQEIKFVQTLPKEPKIFNNVIEYFIETVDSVKYLCSVWELHCSNIDSVIRKGDFNFGFPLDIVKKIMKQLILSIYILHSKFKVFHGDIKTDNILIKGINDKDLFIIEKYKEANFFEQYQNAKKSQSGDKLSIRLKVHQQIVESIIDQYNKTDLSQYSINSKYLEKMNISLADFGTHCDEHNHYDESFGTRYYQAPEIILMGKCSYPVDIWALGCTFYELLTGSFLFDPIKDAHYSRDYYHLCLINDTCGNFPSQFLKRTKHYKKFFNLNCKIFNHHTSLENRLDRKLKETHFDTTTKEQIKELLISMLHIDPSKRQTIKKLFQNPFFG